MGHRKCEQVQTPDGSWKCMRCGKTTLKEMELSCVASTSNATVRNNMMSLANRYYKERKIWMEAGKPYRTEEEMAAIYEVCKECPFFEKTTGPGGKCGVCGCYLSPTRYYANKISWATTSCPDEPKKWNRSENPQHLDVEHDESSHDFLEPSLQENVQSPFKGRRGGGGCCGK